MAAPRSLLALCILALSARVAHAQFDSVDAKTKAVCKAAGRVAPPLRDRPTARQAAGLKGCNAEALYYGEGRKPDAVQARLCAYVEADAKPNDRTDGPFSGEAILMQVYANGVGVPRNLDVALHFACAVDGAPAEIEGRVSHLQALKTKPDGKRFDYCDDITSGLGAGQCTARGAEQAKAPRTARLGALEGKIPAGAKPLYPALKAASAAFIDKHGDEVDQSGSARAAFVIEEEEASRDRFIAHLAALLAGRWPPASAAQAAAADAALNAAYRKASAFLATKDNFSTVKPAEVKAAQRAWLAYRDAFVRFARAAAPRVSAEAVTALLTRERTGQLNGLVG